jgi:glycosyltransferase involved in cell wall biosynthesis
VSEPHVSIVSPTLERAVLLEQTIRSVKRQSFRGFEHIVVDGGSRDGTLEILRRHEGTYPLRWISEPDAGMYDAINKGFAMADGEILGYLNSDDLYFPWTLETVVDAFDSDPRLDLVYGDAIRLDEGRRLREPVFQPPPVRALLAASGSLFQPSVFWRRRIFERLHGFDVALRFAADLDFWLRALSGASTARVDELLSIHRVHGATLSRSHYTEMADETWRVRGRYRKGVRATVGARILGRARYELWWRVLWLRLAAAAARGPRGHGAWRRSIAVLRPRIGLPRTVVGLAPFVGGAQRGKVKWARDPLEAALVSSGADELDA